MYLRQSRAEEAEAIYQLVRDNPYIAEFQYWARKSSLEKIAQGVEERMAAIRAGTSMQYRLIVPASVKYGGIVGTLTAYDYDDDRKLAKIGYYQAESAQGKGYMRDAVTELIKTMKSVWGVTTIEFDIEDSNERSHNLSRKLGAVSTDVFVDCDCQGTMIPNRVWRLVV